MRLQNLYMIALTLTLIEPIMAEAKTRMLVEDPNNLVIARVSLTPEQRQEGAIAAQDLLANALEKDRGTAFAARYVAIASGSLTDYQLAELSGTRCGSRRRSIEENAKESRNETRFTVVLYDTQRRRIMHNRLYIVSWLPERHSFCRLDDYTPFYLGRAELSGKEVIAARGSR